MSSFSSKICFLLIVPYILCNLTAFEKDRYLACGEFVQLLRTYDKDEIRQTLTQEEYLFQGVNSLISVDMMINCLHNINDTLVQMMYVNMERVMNDTGIDDSEIEFIKVNYSDYANITEFKFDEEKTNVTLTLREVYYEYAELHAPPKEEREKVEKERKKSNYTKKTLSEDDYEGYEEREIDFSKLFHQNEENKEANNQEIENNDKEKRTENQPENKEKNEDL